LVFVGSAFGADINPARTQALIESRDPRKVIAVRLMKLGISRFLGRLAGRVLCDGDFSTVALLIFSSRGEIERGNCNDGSSRRNYVARCELKNTISQRRHGDTIAPSPPRGSYHDRHAAD